MDRIIQIDGREVEFRATARTPRLYRVITGRDMIIDLNTLSKSFKKVKESHEKGEETTFSSKDLLIFEDTAYVMARHANPDIEQKNADDWLDTFDMFSIYEVLPQLLQLWGENNRTTSSPKKN